LEWLLLGLALSVPVVAVAASVLLGKHHCVGDGSSHVVEWNQLQLPCGLEKTTFDERCVRHSSHLRIDATGMFEVFDAASLCVNNIHGR